MENQLPLSFILPTPANLPTLALPLLDTNSENLQDLLLHTSTLVSKLNHDSSDLNNRLLNLRIDLTKHVVSYISTSLSAKLSLDTLKSNLESLSLLLSRALGKRINRELQQLVEELCRIQNMRRYLVTALKLESLVGDLEDSVFHPIRNHQGRLQDLALKHKRFKHAIKTMNEIEEMLDGVTMHHKRLVDSVDSRVDKSLSVLRPQVIAEHRAFLSSLGWPPKLTTSEEVASIPNPLLLMEEDQKEFYSQSFLLLCGLQKISTKKEKRNNVGLWAIDELVIPVSTRMEHHFLKWIEQPEFIFALVYKVTKDFVDGVDDFLQSLIDRAMLVSYSAKEAWVSGMVQMLSCFLEKKILPGLIDMFHEKKPEVVSSWFYLVDQMVTFDKRMQSFVNSDIFGESSLSVMGVFCNKPEWLKTWGKIELKEAYRKMKEDVKNEKAWVVVDTDRKAPFIADSFLNRTRDLIDRGLSLPAMVPRIQFVKATATKLLWYIFKFLLLEFKKIDLSHFEEDRLIQACGPINTARYLESKLREWSDDLVFVEMFETETKSQDCFFGEELKSLVELETNWLMEIITVCLQQFDNHFHRDSSEEVSTVSQGVAEALDSLRRHLCVLNLNMNQKDFSDLWRNLAEGLDHYVCCKFFSGEEEETVLLQSKEFEVDVEALLMVFRPYCVRPSAFFPRVRDILRLLKMCEEEKKRLRDGLRRNRNSCLKLFGISKLSSQLVEQFCSYK